MPSRGGVRGGKDQFDWEDVKADKYRENYLGHSLKAPIGHVHKVREQNWYMKDGTGDQQKELNEEVRMIKEMESRGMAIALGQEDTNIRDMEEKGESVSLSDKMVKEILGVSSSGKDIKIKKKSKKIKREKKEKKREKNEKSKHSNELKISTNGLTNKSKHKQK
ncbi:Multiple myeloma tumor-associated protein 2-like [Oopsacas minuta]|uniref:Multiple myeloma tumor-associated protein 2-like n=1 Tax=Oopsacas minuta TaxID=111878 RepID=A0AAV7K0I5_9METZ|nr:Multiple myeloma tumor-associated protein 2-like [Oopsacas minuta]